MVTQPNKRAKAIAQSKAVMQRIGTKLVNDKREAILASNGIEEIDKKSVIGRDLLTVLSECVLGHASTEWMDSLQST